MKLLAALLCSCLAAFGAGTVSTSTDQLGNTGTWVISWNWTGDASSGSVPITPAVGLGPLQGYLITQLEASPGTPSPTSGYSVAIKDSAGVDVFGGAASSCSATAPQAFAAAASTPPVNGTLQLVITGQNVASAKGRVYVFLSKPTTVARSSGVLSAGVTSFNARTGVVIPATADYTFSQIAGNITLHGHADSTQGGQLGIGAVLAGSLSGNGSKLGTVTGSQTSGKCLEWDASGNIVTAVINAACGSGGGGSPGGSFGQVQYNNSGAFGGFTVGADATLNTGTGALTLATVNANTGACGDATHFSVPTFNAKGLATGCTAQSIAAGGYSATFSPTANTPFTINHALNLTGDKRNFNSTFWDSTNTQIFPASLDAVDANNATVTFVTNLTNAHVFMNAGGVSSTPGGTTGQVQFNNSGAFGGFTVGGDATLNTANGALTLATVNSNVGSCGDATHVCQTTFNAKGLATAATAVAISGGGGGASSVTQLTDGQAVLTSSTVVTVGAFICGVSEATTTFGSSATLTISAGTATAYVSCDMSVSPATLKVYNNGLTIVCTGMSCNNVSGSAFGVDDIPLFLATAVSGAWTTLTEQRSLNHRDRNVAGYGMSKSSSAGTATFAVDSAVIAPLNAPAFTGAANTAAWQIAKTASDPGCTVSGDLGRMWIDSTSATTTHFKVCANVSSSPAWVTVF